MGQGFRGGDMTGGMADGPGGMSGMRMPGSGMTGMGNDGMRGDGGGFGGHMGPPPDMERSAVPCDPPPAPRERHAAPEPPAGNANQDVDVSKIQIGGKG